MSRGMARRDAPSLVEIIEPDSSVFRRAAPTSDARAEHSPHRRRGIIGATASVVAAAVAIGLAVSAPGGAQRGATITTTTTTATTTATVLPLDASARGAATGPNVAPAVPAYDLNFARLPVATGIPAKHADVRDTPRQVSQVFDRSGTRLGHHVLLALHLVGDLHRVSSAPTMVFFDRHDDDQWRTVAYAIESADAAHITIRSVENVGDFPPLGTDVPQVPSSRVLLLPTNFLPDGHYRACRNVVSIDPPAVLYLCSEFDAPLTTQPAAAVVAR